jgi:hypothetical protein
MIYYKHVGSMPIAQKPCGSAKSPYVHKEFFSLLNISGSIEGPNLAAICSAAFIPIYPFQNLGYIILVQSTVH